MQVETNMNRICTSVVETVPAVSADAGKEREGCDGELSLGWSGGHFSQTKDIQKAENGHHELRKQVTLPGKAVRSNAPRLKVDSKREIVS